MLQLIDVEPRREWDILCDSDTFLSIKNIYTKKLKRHFIKIVILAVPRMMFVKCRIGTTVAASPCLIVADDKTGVDSTIGAL